MPNNQTWAYECPNVPGFHHSKYLSEVAKCGFCKKLNPAPPPGIQTTQNRRNRNVQASTEANPRPPPLPQALRRAEVVTIDDSEDEEDGRNTGGLIQQDRFSTVFGNRTDAWANYKLKCALEAFERPQLIPYTAGSAPPTQRPQPAHGTRPASLVQFRIQVHVVIGRWAVKETDEDENVVYTWNQKAHTEEIETSDMKIESLEAFLRFLASRIDKIEPDINHEENTDVYIVREFKKSSGPVRKTKAFFENTSLRKFFGIDQSDSKSKQVYLQSIWVIAERKRRQIEDEEGRLYTPAPESNVTNSKADTKDVKQEAKQEATQKIKLEPKVKAEPGVTKRSRSVQKIPKQEPRDPAIKREKEPTPSFSKPSMSTRDTSPTTQDDSQSQSEQDELEDIVQAENDYNESRPPRLATPPPTRHKRTISKVLSPPRATGSTEPGADQFADPPAHCTRRAKGKNKG